MNNKILFIAILSMTLGSSFCYSQQKKVTYDINRLLNENKLTKAYPRQTVAEVTDGSKKGLTSDGILWLKNVNFKTGTIDVDLRGRDVFQQSFLGIAFHGVDTTTNDVIYFRPFNFQTTDTLRRMHTVQYISEPDFPWDKLRKEHPLVYENAVNPFPEATAWFHARIVVNADDIVVYVDHSDKPSLTVKKLNNRQNGLIGLWSSGLPGDFANLAITQ
ncbi:hypothetical protein SAMN05192574_104475 [Mucilaginibacter gossypiicola]|uniref:3-keto-disaccharide hydrolase domain-containing protein n=1 Tax=Mucilaginibacter gossypiicola TaxID=551995 RepID=A0A1H8K6X0_9SPHI|nr:hypothetical protein [Mucilaginibacter gossypiicola]SEN88491.1 hypothetical protein SAMN05192574_104475 [Mucilaginibacter gossypiicola]